MIVKTIRCTLCLVARLLALGSQKIAAEDKGEQLRAPASSSAKEPKNVFARPAPTSGKGTRIVVANGKTELPLAVVSGTPYEMGYQFGELFRTEIHEFVPPTVAAVAKQLNVSQATLCEVWARSAAYGDDRVEQELAGLADGSGIPLPTLQALHAAPILMPYSCSSIAAWGKATEDGHLFQTRNLDWTLELNAQQFPAIVVYVPDHGIPHVVPTFAGVIGAHTGLNARGIALAEMGDASAREMPYDVHAPHFTIFFRTLLYDADSLTRALDIFQAQPMTKRYHFVFGDGLQEHRAVKVRAHAPEKPDQRVAIWKDNDPADEFAPNVLSCVVYNDEGRGAFPTLKVEHGQLNGKKLIELANRIPIKGDNVINVVYDATALKMWVSYARGKEEAYKRPYVYVDLQALDADHDGKPDFQAPTH